jgi:hypothetical protein
MTYTFGGAGNYTLEVISFNNCGISIPRTQEVVAQGTAPPPPEPITGPEESCVGSTETYTANPSPGLNCLWWINGVQQPDTSNSIEITWEEPGNHLLEARAVTDCGTSNPALLEVTVWLAPAVDLGPDTAIYQGESLILDAENTGSSYLWSTGDTTQSIEVSVEGTYSVTVTNFCGSDWDDIVVSIITGLEESPRNLNARVYFDGEALRIDPQGQVVHSIKVIHASGKILYDGDFIKIFYPTKEGLLIVLLYTDNGKYSFKVFVP